MKVCLIGSNKVKCGVKDYSDLLCFYLNGFCQVEQIAVPSLPAKADFSELAAVVNDKKFDLIHLQHAPSFYGGDRISAVLFKDFVLQLKGKKIVTLHEVARGERLYIKQLTSTAINQNLRNFLFNKLCLKKSLRILISSLESFQKIVVHSECQKEYLIKLGVQNNKISVIPHGVPVVIKSSAEIDYNDPNFQLKGKFIIGTFGFIKSFKNYEAVINLLNNLPDNIVYLIMGGPQDENDAKYFNWLKVLIQRKKLSSRVMITGYLIKEDLHKYLRMCNLIIFPYQSSVASGAMAYAFAYGKAIIASNLDINKDIHMRHPGSLILFSHSFELKDKILQLFADKERLFRVEKEAGEYARIYSFKEMAIKTLNLYQSIMGV